jgi:hypothetical protein
MDKKKRHARDIQALTGRSCCSALNLMRAWKAEGKNLQEEIEKLASEANAREDTAKDED